LSDFRENVLKRIKQVEDLMGAIVFLASGAAKMMARPPVMVDGGWTVE
jgi:NAD(P)-dependent dehydrogenase (short-subunit alcohol dehydrogenase family)